MGFFSSLGNFAKSAYVPAPGMPEPKDMPKEMPKGKPRAHPMTKYCKANRRDRACVNKCRGNPHLPWCGRRTREAAEKMAEEATPAPAPQYQRSQYQYSRDDEERERMRGLQEKLEKRRKARERYMKAHREQLAKQAAYTRDTTQARGRGQAYATEAEKLMGGQTGYGSFDSYARFGLTALDNAVKKVKRASQTIKKMTEDVQGGIIPKGDLKFAILDLETKTQAVADLKKKAGLSGFGESKIPSWGTIAVAVAVAALAIRSLA